MSFRGNRGGRGRGGGFRGRGGRGGRGGFHSYDQGPPETVIEIGECMHPCEGDLVCKNTNEKIPYFNAPVYLENKSQIGKVDDIFGPIKENYFSVKLLPNMEASSFKKAQKFFIDPMKLLPLMRFLPQPGGQRRGGVQKRGGFRGENNCHIVVRFDRNRTRWFHTERWTWRVHSEGWAWL